MLSKGKLKLDDPLEYDQNLKAMMTDPMHLLYENFHKNIRPINSSYFFLFFGANIQEPPGKGDYVFMVNGHPSHYMDTLIPDENHDARYAQVYVMDDQISRQNHPANQKIDKKSMNTSKKLCEKKKTFIWKPFKA